MVRFENRTGVSEFVPCLAVRKCLQTIKVIPHESGDLVKVYFIRLAWSTEISWSSSIDTFSRRNSCRTNMSSPFAGRRTINGILWNSPPSMAPSSESTKRLRRFRDSYCGNFRFGFLCPASRVAFLDYALVIRSLTFPRSLGIFEVAGLCLVGGRATCLSIRLFSQECVG